MSSSRTTVDKNSCDAEIEPSVVRDEDIASSSLNEAPRKKYQCLSLHREILTEIYEDGFVLNYGQIVALLNSRDGQPG